MPVDRSREKREAVASAGGPQGGKVCIDKPSLTLLSWNIYRNYRPAKIEATLRRLAGKYDPDVLLLQETPVYEDYGFSELELFTDYYAFYAPAHVVTVPSTRLNFKSTGQLILSRHAFDRTAVHELPVLPGRVRQAAAGISIVKRNALYARFNLCSGGTLGLYNIHLENRAMPSGRLKQVRHLLEVIRRKDDRIVVVGGDFNTFLTSAFEKALALFQREGFTNVFSFSKASFLPRLDYFMIRGAAAERGVQLRGEGSDHRPIMVTIHL